MSTAHPSSQWDHLLQNIGVWQGSFTRLTPEGAIRDDCPSLVTLEGLHDNQTIRQTNQYFSPDTGELNQEKVFEYSSLSRGVLVFETGAFSQGSMQHNPFSAFGAELGLVVGDRRLRLVQLFTGDGASALSGMTLIREQRQNSQLPVLPPLTVDQLLGTWRGTATTLYPDWRSPDQDATTLSITQEGDRLIQQLTTSQWEFTSTAQIQASKLQFDQGSHPIQVLLLPGGASCNTPLTIPKGRPFLLEAGWLIEPHLRQRLIRRYDAQGGWVSLTLVTEAKT